MSKKIVNKREIKWSVIQKPFFSHAYILESRGKPQALLRTKRQACLLITAPAFVKASSRALELLAELPNNHKDKQPVMAELARALHLYRIACMKVNQK